MTYKTEIKIYIAQCNGERKITTNAFILVHFKPVDTLVHAQYLGSMSATAGPKQEEAFFSSETNGIIAAVKRNQAF